MVAPYSFFEVGMYKMHSGMAGAFVFVAGLQQYDAGKRWVVKSLSAIEFPVEKRGIIMLLQKEQ